LQNAGLLQCTNGLMYSLHVVCGDHIEVGDLLQLLPTVVVMINQKDPGVIKLVSLIDKANGCTIATSL
jgi:hypothetical protein